MSGELYAVLAALGFASYYVVTKHALRSGSVVGGVLLSLTGAFAVLGVAVLASAPHQISASGFGYFFGAGVLAAGLGTVASIAGVHRLGPSTSVPIETGSHPAVAVAIAASVLGETVTAQQLVGIAAIVLGGCVLARTVDLDGDDGPGTDAAAPAGRTTVTRLRPTVLAAVALPVFAGSAYAGSDVISKIGLDQASDPLVGAITNIGAGLLGWIVATLSVPALRRAVTFGAAHVFLIAGAFLGFGLFALYEALDASEVSVVAPIIGAQPLVVFALSRFLLHDIEHIKPFTVAGGVVVIMGTILVVSSGT
jgi:drug/metabolite transporter (DMT)-like permease